MKTQCESTSPPNPTRFSRGSASTAVIGYPKLSAFCTLANKAIRKHYGRPDSCVFSTGVVCEVLLHFGIKAEALRVEAAIFPDDSQHYGCILGGIGDGTRRAAKPDMWQGHLVS